MDITALIKQAKSLPLARRQEWILSKAAFHIEIDELEGETPEILICISEKGIIGSNIISSSAPDCEVINWLAQCLASPKVGRPCRPGTLVLAGGGLAHLKKDIESLGITVALSESSPPIVDNLVQEMEQSLNSPGLPPFMTQIDPADMHVVELFFDSAAAFYKQKPWKFFEYELPLKIEVTVKGRQERFWVVITGMLSEANGLALYKSYEDVENLLDTDTPEEALWVIQSSWTLAFCFVRTKDIGPLAQKELEANGWTLASRSAYPSALVVDGDAARPRLPRAAELESLAAVTLALAVIFKDNKSEIKTRLKNEDGVSLWRGALLGTDAEVPFSLWIPAPECYEDIGAFDYVLEADD